MAGVPSSSHGGGGAGTVTSVAAGDASIVVGGDPTVAPTLETASLATIASLHASAGAIAASGQKITGLADGAAASDAAAFGQIPATLPTSQSLAAIGVANPNAADVPMNAHKITGLANGSASDDAAAFGQIAAAGMTVISDVTLAGNQASFDITGIAGTFRHLVITAALRSDVGSETNAFGQMTFNNDGANHYDKQYVWGNNTASGNQASAAASMAIPVETGPSATAGHFGFQQILIPYYASTAFNKVAILQIAMFSTDAGGTAFFAGVVAGQWRSTAAITRVTVFPSNAANNFVAGSRFTLYGW